MAPLDTPSKFLILLGDLSCSKVQCGGHQESRFEQTFRVRGVHGDEKVLWKFRDKTNGGVSDNNAEAEINGSKTDIENRNVAVVSQVNPGVAVYEHYYFISQKFLIRLIFLYLLFVPVE